MPIAANPIALRAIRSILSAEPPASLVVAGQKVMVKAERVPAAWPELLTGLDEATDGPWPGSLRLLCSWDGGATVLRVMADYWRVINPQQRHTVGLRIYMDVSGQEILWSSVAGALAEAEPSDEVMIGGDASIKRRQGEAIEFVRDLRRQLIAKLDQSSDLPRYTNQSVKLFAVRCADGAVLPSPEEALRRSIGLALLKLPFFGRGQLEGVEGKPLFSVENSSPSKVGREPAASAKYAAVYGLPGGVSDYKNTLDGILTWVSESPRTLEDLTRLFAERFEVTGAPALASYRAFIWRLGLLEDEEGPVALTRTGADYLDERSPFDLFEILARTHNGMVELLAATAEGGPLPMSGARDALRLLIGATWGSDTQFAVRRNWLLSLGLTSRGERGDAMTELGRTVLSAHSEAAEFVSLLRAAPPPPPAPVVEPDDEGNATVSAERVALKPDLVKPFLGDLRLPPGVLESACAALSCGSHLLLVGPPGTGKTELAHALARAAEAQEACAGVSIATASADWTTFETIGGYGLAPTEKGQALVFRPGVFLQALEENRWLVIDELNRADVDRSFGELMTVLTGKPTRLPYQLADGRAVSIGRPGDPSQPDGGFTHPVPGGFRLLATMNSWDKTSLFRLSYAVQRRFAILYVGIPDDKTYGEVIQTEASASWYEPPLDPEATQRVSTFFSTTSLLQHREIGPAIARDMTRYLRGRGGTGDAFAEACELYLLPQLEGLGAVAARAVEKLLTGILEGWATVAARDRLRARLRDVFPDLGANP